ncbi:gluconate 2-dehydrogenase subunit 3 family protein [Microbacterium radiodurans]|uniref:Gluconate 2-dehydrogenase subunit 3 family protein n=1 Tax=Microbacterium radiodurans TaxID=661398 RepID=A0A5J5IPD3_9MICO|nr:gluconate 2-dehydrogenase subunit 3 family protein [Microbacterium radiodurans]KAA9085302.1 gluconate 2-dehydrogenase subunit 3 family protein [Microbacterium radiodurans]
MSDSPSTVFALPEAAAMLAAPSASARADDSVRFERVSTAEVDGVLSAIRDAGVFDPFLLVAASSEAPAVAAACERILDGEPGLFGLAAVVVLGHSETTSAPTSIIESEVPVRVVAAEDADAATADIASFAGEVAARAPRVPAAWARIIASDRTDVAVRATLARRALADDPDYRPEGLDDAQLALLRRVAARLVPQGDGPVIDLGARADRMIVAGESDGWRPTGMSTDVEAYRAGLDALGAVWPAVDTGDGRVTGHAADHAAEDSVIRGILDETVPGGDVLTPGQLALWFEDLRNDLARLWMSHPASLARVGYSGFATGGTGATPAGYRVLAAGEREEWEPVELGRLVAEGQDR